MKSIGSATTGTDWNKSILRQLSFIKKNLRYPIDRRTGLPVALMAASLPAFGIMCYALFFTKSTSHYGHRWPIYLVGAAILTVPIVAFRRYWQTLHFISVHARRDVGSNMELLRQFLTAHHFAFTRHPEAPEIFQIISRNIASLSDEREVVFFIADEGRILVNSHFTHTGYRAPVGAPHCRQIAGMLREWLKRTDSGGQNEVRVF